MNQTQMQSAGRELIPVMHCFDNNYVIPAAVSFYSMLKYADPKYQYRLYVLHTDITTQNQALLQNVVGQFPNASLEFISMNHWLEDVFQSLLHENHFSKEVIYKLSVGSIFPQYDKLIITDVDVAFCGDIAPSYVSMDPDSEICFAGVHHVCPKDSWLVNYYDHYDAVFGKGHRERMKICGGYLVANLKRLREAGKEAIFLDYLEANTDKLLQLEQDVINFCCDENEIAYLPLEYIVCSYAYDMFETAESREQDEHYSREEIERALKNPIQLHYATSVKPWKDIHSTKADLWMKFLFESGVAQTYFDRQRGLAGPAPEQIDAEHLRHGASMPEPDVTVSVLCCTYNHQQFIRETLQAIVGQKTNFRFEVLVADDASTDETQAIIREFQQQYPEIFRCTLREKNVGIGENYYQTLQQARGKYLAICDGDDLWIDDHKLQKEVDFLERHSDFNVVCTSFQKRELKKDGTFEDSVFDVDHYIQLSGSKKESYGLKDLLHIRFVASCTAMLRWQFRGGFVPDFLRNYKTIDFPLALMHAACGKIGVLGKEVTARYHVHAGGITSQQEYNMLREVTQILREIDQYLDYRFAEVLAPVIAAGSGTSSKKVQPMYTEEEKVSLCVMDDVFPHPASGFRLAEYKAYLDAFEKVRVVCSGHSVAVLGEESITDLCKDFVQAHPEYSDEITIDDHLPRNAHIDLAYFGFLENVWPHLDELEERAIPFVLELYPGGGFARFNPEVDHKLRLVLSSPCLRKVITTQPATTRYLLEKNFCSPDQIQEIFGVVTPEETLAPYGLAKKRYGFEKDRLDVVFTAFRYMPDGADKGYDVFVDMAKRICHDHENVYFHVVGGFDENDLDVSSLKGHITFYGKQHADWFDVFYQDKDLIVSPNVPDVLAPGAFDGFPTASCTEAALRGVAMFVTDPLEMNEGHFAPGQEIEIVPHDAAEIAARLEYYLEHPDQLRALAEGGANAVRRIYSAERQIKPRIALVGQEMEEARREQADLPAKIQQTGRIKTWAYRVFGILEDGKLKELAEDVCIERNSLEIHTKLADAPNGLQKILFYPAETYGVILREVSVFLDGRELPVQVHNGVEIENTLYFATEEAQIICEVPQKAKIPLQEVVLEAKVVALEKNLDAISWEIKQAVQRLCDQSRKNVHGTCKLYFSNDRRFNEEHSLQGELVQVAPDCYVSAFSLAECAEPVSFVRFDPIEGVSIQADLLRAFCDGIPMKLKRSNGKGWKGRRSFSDSDPWYEYEMPKTSAQEVVFVFEMKQH